MGGLSLWHWIIVLLVVLILFGRGRISDIMGDFGKGIKSFKEGINEESGEHRAPAPAAPPPVQIAPHQVVPGTEATVMAPVATPVAPTTTPPGVPPVPTDIKTGV